MFQTTNQLLLAHWLGIMITHSIESYQPTSFQLKGIEVFWIAQTEVHSWGNHQMLHLPASHMYQMYGHVPG